MSNQRQKFDLHINGIMVERNRNKILNTLGLCVRTLYRNADKKGFCSVLDGNNNIYILSKRNTI